VLAFDIEHSQWVAILGSDNKLKDFTGFSMEYYGTDSVYLIGGINSNMQHTNALYSFTLARGIQKQASMKTPRSHFGSLVLGNNIYVVGGQTIGESTNHCEVYDVIDNYWATFAPMPVALNCCVAVARSATQILVLGGMEFAPNRRIYSYQTTDDTWTVISTLMPIGLSRPLVFV
jgi:N-acetylneuraminic acid mutarotase